MGSRPSELLPFLCETLHWDDGPVYAFPAPHRRSVVAQASTIAIFGKLEHTGADGRAHSVRSDENVARGRRPIHEGKFDLRFFILGDDSRGFQSLPKVHVRLTLKARDVTR